MSNVIRPTFGKPPAAPAPEAAADTYRALRVFGEAAGHVVAMIRDDGAPEGPVFRIVVGPLPGDAVEAVAVLPAEPEREADAEAIGFAVVRALEIVAGGPEAGQGPGVA